jgi:hypothetical protein
MMPANTIVHQHYRPSREFLDVAEEYDIHLVTTLRDPYDQFVSLYFYVQRFSDAFREADDPAQTMIGKTIGDEAVVQFLETSFGRYLEQGVAWLRSQRSQIIRYEELVFSPEEAC